MSWRDVIRFADMRNRLDEEIYNLVAKPKERKDTGLCVLARMFVNRRLTIAVRKSHRGKALAKKYKVLRIELEVFGKNPAIRLYERLGYEIEGRRKDAVEDEGTFDDVIFMAKFI